MWKTSRKAENLYGYDRGVTNIKEARSVGVNRIIEAKDTMRKKSKDSSGEQTEISGQNEWVGFSKDMPSTDDRNVLERS